MTSLVRQFTLEGISGGNAVFNPEKLDWMNQQHISRLTPEELAERNEPLMKQAGLWRDAFAGQRAALAAARDRAAEASRVERWSSSSRTPGRFSNGALTPESEAAAEALVEAGSAHAVRGADRGIRPGRSVRGARARAHAAGQADQPGV